MTTKVNRAYGYGNGILVAAAFLAMVGCRKPSDQAVVPIPPTVQKADGVATVPLANAVAGLDLAQLTAITNQFATEHRAQSELIQKLLGRIELLESKSGAQSDSERSALKAREDAIIAQNAQAQGLLKQIADLQTQVGALQAGRVLPEISLASTDGPSPQELDQQIKVAERKRELAAEAAEARAKESPKLTVGSSGFALSSADTNFVIKLKGLVQLDSRTFFDDNPLSKGNDTFLLRRARPILEGTLYRDIDFQFVPEFGGPSVQIVDAWLNYKFLPELQLRAGKFKGPVGFENLQADATTPFNERSLVTDLIPSRSLGLQLSGDIDGGLVSYAAGMFNGSGDSRNPNTSDFGDDKEVAVRLASQPFKNTNLAGLAGLSFGVGGSYSQVNSNALALPNPAGGTLPGYTTTAGQQFFAHNPVVGPVVADGVHWRVSPYMAYLRGPFGLLGEYAISYQGVLNNTTLRKAELEHDAWQISAQWVLTGESASFTGILPNRPFNLRTGGWGAWQLVGRFGQLDIDDDAFPSFSNPNASASGATSWNVGINWWLNRNLRVLTSYGRTTFENAGSGLTPLDPLALTPPAAVTHQDESVFSTRLQLSF